MPDYRVKLYLASRPADPIAEATLTLPRGPDDWSARGAFVPDTDVEPNEYILELPEAVLPRQRVSITLSDDGEYELARIT